MNLAFYLPHGVFGGGERILHTLMNQFHKLGHNVIIYSSNSTLDTTKLNFPYKIFYGNKLLQTFSIAKHMKKSNIDAFICFGKMNQYLIATKLANVKFIYSLRTDPLQSNWSRPNAKWTIKYCNGAVFQTKKVQAFFSENIQKKSIVIFNPIMDDLPPISPKREKKIAIVGRLSEEKNQKMAIEAFSMVDKGEYTLHIFGQGPLEGELKQFVQHKGLNNCVFFEGQVDNVVNNIYNYEMCLLTSNFEGMPNALIEGLALGLACISTNFPSGAAQELIQSGKNGFIVPMNDTKALAEKIQILINDDKLRESFQKNAEAIRTQLNREMIINKWVDYIERVVKS